MTPTTGLPSIEVVGLLRMAFSMIGKIMVLVKVLVTLHDNGA